ncbi:MAG: HDOD domain-containing protein, partial [bacterium]
MPDQEISIEKIKQITEKIQGLPTLPVLVTQTMHLIDNPKTSISEIVKAISVDQALTIKILRLANSAFYGFPRKIATVKHALVILGSMTLKDLIIATSIHDVFPETEGEGRFKRSDFWEHSFACGIASRMLAKEVQYRVTGEVFVAGIIHDIGKIIIDKYFHPQFKKIIKIVEEENITIYEAEKKVLGITHVDLGRWLAQKWNLPSDLVDAIAYHHSPKLAKSNQELTTIVHLADILCRMKAIGYGGDPLVPKIDDGVWDIFKTRRTDLKEMHLEKFANNLEE